MHFNHPDNMLAIDKNLYRRISGYYSSKPNFTGGKTFRDFLMEKILRNNIIGELWFWKMPKRRYITVLFITEIV